MAGTGAVCASFGSQSRAASNGYHTNGCLMKALYGGHHAGCYLPVHDQRSVDVRQQITKFFFSGQRELCNRFQGGLLGSDYDTNAAHQNMAKLLFSTSISGRIRAKYQKPNAVSISNSNTENPTPCPQTSFHKKPFVTGLKLKPTKIQFCIIKSF